MTATPHGTGHGSNRPVVMGRNGMVCAGHPLASLAGITVLQKGGNAVDAAIAVAAALNVVEPLMSGIGGDGFILVHWNGAGNGRRKPGVRVVNATGAAPQAATRESYLADGIPMKGAGSVSVPGLLDGWAEAHDFYGDLKWSQVFEPAIDLAENGSPVSHVISRSIAEDELLRTFPTSRAVFAPDGKPPGPGQIVYQRDLARSFKKIAAEGRDTFYRGEIARAIARFSQDNGGALSLKDLESHRARWQDPISTTYRGNTVYEAPPNSSGHILLQELNVVETMDLQALGCNSAESIHLMVEAKKLAFADREAYVADPEFVEAPIAGLLSKEYARERAALIDPGHAAAGVQAGDPWRRQGSSSQGPSKLRIGAEREDTTCFCVVDRWGNAVCQLQSIQSQWGSSLIAGDTGILLNNRMTYWHLEEDHVNCLQPGKRVRHTMNPVMVLGPTGNLLLVCGTPGADTQVQTNLQVISHVLDFGMTVAEAVEAPRWRSTQDGTESTAPHSCPDELHMEGRFPREVREGLSSRGHQLNILADWGGTGSEMMVQVHSESGALMGAADPRRDGYAVGW